MTFLKKYFFFFADFVSSILVSNFYVGTLITSSVSDRWMLFVTENPSCGDLKTELHCMVIQVSSFLRKPWCLGGVSSWIRFMRGKLNLLEGWSLGHQVFLFVCFLYKGLEFSVSHFWYSLQIFSYIWWPSVQSWVANYLIWGGNA